MATLIKKIDELLNNNRLDTAIDLAQSAIENVDREYHNTLILLKSQLRGNETDFGKNLITRNEYIQTKARILTGFQNLLESFPKSVLESHVNDLEITGNGKISLQDTGNSTININKQPQNQTNMLTPKELAGYQSLLELVIEKKIFLQKELLSAVDSTHKFALKQQIKDLEEQIEGLKQKVSTDLQNAQNTVTVGNNSSGNFVLQGISGSNMNIEIKNGLVSLNEKLDKELQEVKGMNDNVSNKPCLAFLTADPKNKNPIRALDQKQIIEDIVKTEYLFKDNTKTKYNELAKTAKNCSILHVTVHGKNKSLIFEHDEIKGEEASVNADYFVFQLEENNQTFDLILLIACSSADIAKAIVDKKLTKAAIGTSIDISAEAAVDFTKRFYMEFIKNNDIKTTFTRTCFHLNNNPKRPMHDTGEKYDYSKAFVLYTI